MADKQMQDIVPPIKITMKRVSESLPSSKELDRTLFFPFPPKSELFERLSRESLWPLPPNFRDIVASFPLYYEIIFCMGFPHELLHYIPARLLGMKARMGAGVTLTQKSAPVWKKMIVSLSPALFGLMLVAVCSWITVGAQGKWHVFWFLMTIAAVFWILACARDFLDVWRLLHS